MDTLLGIWGHRRGDDAHIPDLPRVAGIDGVALQLASDARGREILERTESLTPDQLMQLHASMRNLRLLRKEDE